MACIILQLLLCFHYEEILIDIKKTSTIFLPTDYSSSQRIAVKPWELTKNCEYSMKKDKLFQLLLYTRQTFMSNGTLDIAVLCMYVCVCVLGRVGFVAFKWHPPKHNYFFSSFFFSKERFSRTLILMRFRQNWNDPRSSVLSISLSLEAHSQYLINLNHYVVVLLYIYMF